MYTLVFLAIKKRTRGYTIAFWDFVYTLKRQRIVARQHWHRSAELRRCIVASTGSRLWRATSSPFLYNYAETHSQSVVQDPRSFGPEAGRLGLMAIGRSMSPSATLWGLLKNHYLHC